MSDVGMEVADLLHGYEEIGGFLRISTEAAKHRALRKVIPTFKMGRLVCARRSSLLAWMRRQELIANQDQAGDAA